MRGGKSSSKLIHLQKALGVNGSEEELEGIWIEWFGDFNRYAASISRDTGKIKIFLINESGHIKVLETIAETYLPKEMIEEFEKENPKAFSYLMEYINRVMH